MKTRVTTTLTTIAIDAVLERASEAGLSLSAYVAYLVELGLGFQDTCTGDESSERINNAAMRYTGRGVCVETAHGKNHKARPRTDP